MIIGFILYFIIKLYKNRSEAAYLRDSFDTLSITPNIPCADCGPGGMFGLGSPPANFMQNPATMEQRARDLSGGISDSEFKAAINRAGGFMPYIKGRETAIRRMDEATADLRGVMNIPGVNGTGTVNEGIEIAVINEATKKKVQQFVAEKNKKFIPNPPGTYGGIPVNIVIRPMAVAK